MKLSDLFADFSYAFLGILGAIVAGAALKKEGEKLTLSDMVFIVGSGFAMSYFFTDWFLATLGVSDSIGMKGKNGSAFLVGMFSGIVLKKLIVTIKEFDLLNPIQEAFRGALSRLTGGKK